MKDCEWSIEGFFNVSWILLLSLQYERGSTISFHLASFCLAYDRAMTWRRQPSAMFLCELIFNWIISFTCVLPFGRDNFILDATPSLGQRNWLKTTVLSFADISVLQTSRGISFGQDLHPWRWWQSKELIISSLEAGDKRSRFFDCEKFYKIHSNVHVSHSGLENIKS